MVVVAQPSAALAARQTGMHNQQRAPALAVVVPAPVRLALMRRPIPLVGQAVTGFRPALQEPLSPAAGAAAVVLTRREPQAAREEAATAHRAQLTQAQQAAQILVAVAVASGQPRRLALAAKA
jgi:hypothetical protein